MGRPCARLLSASMARARPHLSNAPITEAVIDFRLRQRPAFDLAALQEMASRLEPEYVKKGPIVALEANLTLSPEGQGSSQMVSQELGSRLHSRDEKYVAQIALNGFSISRLAPYETWEALLGESQRLWAIYLEVAAPELVTRVATRFINNLRLPMQPGDNFESYLTKPPQIPDALPQGMSGFLQRIELHDAQFNIGATLTQFLQTLQAGALPETIPVVLDIDAYRLAEIDPRSKEIWDCLAKLRDFKNLVFYESLTEKAIDLYL